jgi:hypothetical protein
MTVNYETQDSRLASFLQLHGAKFEGTEVRDDDRVLIKFSIEPEELAKLKRAFFEGGQVPALQFANALKSTMHVIREARELSRS